MCLDQDAPGSLDAAADMWNADTASVFGQSSGGTKQSSGGTKQTRNSPQVFTVQMCHRFGPITMSTHRATHGGSISANSARSTTQLSCPDLG